MENLKCRDTFGNNLEFPKDKHPKFWSLAAEMEPNNLASAFFCPIQKLYHGLFSQNIAVLIGFKDFI